MSSSSRSSPLPARGSPSGVPARLAARGRRFVVWLVGWFATGRLLHGFSSRQLRQVDPIHAAWNAASVVAAFGMVAYLVYVVPDDIALMLVGVPLALAGLRLVAFGIISGMAWLFFRIDAFRADRSRANTPNAAEPNADGSPPA